MEPIKTEIVVLGAGPGGYAAAFYAADRGKKVILVEREKRLGGVCLNRGCIPSKALLHATKLISEAKESVKRGISFDSPKIDRQKLRAWKDSILDNLGQGITALAKKRGVDVMYGRGHFEDSQTLRVETGEGQKFIKYDKAIVAVGSKSAMPKAFDLGNPRIMTSREALEVEEVPANLLVVGGGYIGMELGTVYASAGEQRRGGGSAGFSPARRRPRSRQAGHALRRARVSRGEAENQGLENGHRGQTDQGDDGSREQGERRVVRPRARRGRPRSQLRRSWPRKHQGRARRQGIHQGERETADFGRLDLRDRRCRGRRLARTQGITRSARRRGGHHGGRQRVRGRHHSGGRVHRPPGRLVRFDRDRGERKGRPNSGGEIPLGCVGPRVEPRPHRRRHEADHRARNGTHPRRRHLRPGRGRTHFRGRGRRRAWETIAKRRYQEKDRINSIYDRLVRLRHQLARNAGFKNFRDFCHQHYDRFDYTPKDCFTFHDSVEEVVMAAVRKIRERRAREMGLDNLKPWDLAVDPLGREPLRPFRNGQELAQRSRRVFERVDRELGRQFQTLIDHGVLDLDNRPGKEPGGYQTTLWERKLPFIFMNAVGRDTDVRTLLHEGGHAFHMLAAKDEPILDYRHAPMEFCEVASMGMELLANPHTGVFYPNREDKERSARVLLEGTLDILPWIATIDAFQHWVYTNPKHTRAQRTAAWMKLRRRFGDGADWSGHGRYEEVLWHRQGHLFGVPFYYIEYGIAQLGALMVWHRSRKHPKAALTDYKRALRLGGSVGLRELFRTAGGRFDFRTRTMRPLVRAVMETLGF